MECKNCSAQLTLETHFCPSCGAKVIRNRLTIKNLWVDFTEQFLNYDNKLLQTFIGLYTKPHQVIGSYINGTRKKYVNVISYFALAVTLSGIQLFVLRNFYPETMDISVFIPDSAPQTEIDTNWIYDYYSIFVLINIPFYALLSKLTFIGFKKFNYTEHLVINSYLLAQLSITSTFILTPIVMLGVNFYIASNIATLFYIIYVAFSFKKLYELSFTALLLRCLLFVALLIVFIILVGIIQVLFAIITGDFDKMIEDAKKAQEATSYIASSIINWTS